LLERLAGCDATVLVCGETGTGKELAAQAIHRLSKRSAQPLVCINCSAIPDSLLENELFGSEKGAFTGATHRKNGQIHMANNGTLFLDEIGDMSLMSQAKMLRVLEMKEVQRLGAGRPEAVDVRILAATHQNLEKLVTEGRFRQDLYFRLNVFPVVMPPLRERAGDIPLLVERFVADFNRQYHRNIEGVSEVAMRTLMDHSWPGNIRELRNAVEGAFVMCTSGWITNRDIRLLRHRPAVMPVLGPVAVETPPVQPLPSEPDRLLGALYATRWNKSEAAKRLRWSRMTIYRKMAKYNLPAREPSLADSFMQKTVGGAA
jgi:two-component system response regulator HydG/two-component system response regulator AtoC